MRGYSVQAVGVQVLALSFCRGWTISALCGLDPFTGRAWPDGRPQPSWGILGSGSWGVGLSRALGAPLSEKAPRWGE